MAFTWKTGWSWVVLDFYPKCLALSYFNMFSPHVLWLESFRIYQTCLKYWVPMNILRQIPRDAPNTSKYIQTLSTTTWLPPWKLEITWDTSFNFVHHRICHLLPLRFSVRNGLVDLFQFAQFEDLQHLTAMWPAPPYTSNTSKSVMEWIWLLFNTPGASWKHLKTKKQQRWISRTLRCFPWHESSNLNLSASPCQSIRENFTGSNLSGTQSAGLAGGSWDVMRVMRSRSGIGLLQKEKKSKQRQNRKCCDLCT